MAVSVFAPATVANVACGFDVLGLALDSPGDTVTCAPGEGRSVTLESIDGDGGRLSTRSDANTATVAIASLLERAGHSEEPVKVRLHKGLPLASGMGSSAASAVAGVMAVNEFLGLGAPAEELLLSALEGERVAAGAAHADNAAACLHGGFVLVRGPGEPEDELEVIRLPIPTGLSIALVRPHMELSTRDSRTFLGAEIPLASAVAQWSNLGALVEALHTADFDLLSRSLVDHVAEPVRGEHVPGFEAVKAAALSSGALGSSLSGSGPSVFALCRDESIAEAVSFAMAEAFETDAGLSADRYFSLVSSTGARIVEIPQCAS